jgi:hypothetical protein
MSLSSARSDGETNEAYLHELDAFEGTENFEKAKDSEQPQNCKALKLIRLITR